MTIEELQEGAQYAKLHLLLDRDTLRDLFALGALAALITINYGDAQKAYGWADDMLEARDVKMPKPEP